ncbi:DUF2267 domain-containing protein [Altererythrobacter confluentis]|uniref:DUF2267 domain-containing protein n=1 Tax=Allopontixanthobacter confluentis TaxID=1849021 RepID=A0A6L7GB64_9SPHN|nr:DUF2267 domain-containing protein [Allopontixanthobacter confluentis]MXP13209.1 DUF2267 domain-containing protein [Allopontixanthobacter confluentis]
MSTTGLEVFDRTLHATHIWLDEIMEKIGPDRALAWKVLSTVLHKLRDRLPLELAAHLGAQLPLLVRGAYYDQFDPTKMPEDWHSADDFIKQVAAQLTDTRTVGARDAIDAVFGVLDRHISVGQVDKVYQALPKGIRSLWLEPESPGQ